MRRVRVKMIVSHFFFARYSMSVSMRTDMVMMMSMPFFVQMVMFMHMVVFVFMSFFMIMDMTNLKHFCAFLSMSSCVFVFVFVIKLMFMARCAVSSMLFDVIVTVRNTVTMFVRALMVVFMRMVRPMVMCMIVLMDMRMAIDVKMVMRMIMKVWLSNSSDMERMIVAFMIVFVFMMRVRVHGVRDQMQKNVTQKTTDSKSKKNFHGFMAAVDRRWKQK